MARRWANRRDLVLRRAGLTRAVSIPYRKPYRGVLAAYMRSWVTPYNGREVYEDTEALRIIAVRCGVLEKLGDAVQRRSSSTLQEIRRG